MFKFLKVHINLLNILPFAFIFCSGCSPNIKLIGLTYLSKENVPCTMVECNCCNSCQSLISFITGNDTILLTGVVNGEPVVCRGSDCELRNNKMHCAPFDLNKRCEITGNFVTVGKGIKEKLFKITAFKYLD